MTACLSTDGVPVVQEVGPTSGQHDVMKTNEPCLWTYLYVGAVNTPRQAEPLLRTVASTAYDCFSLS
jgi:hypothetical protein